MRGRDQGVRGVFSSGKVKVQIFTPNILLLQVCHHVASVLKKGTTISAWLGVYECSGEESMDVRQISTDVGGVQ